MSASSSMISLPFAPSCSVQSLDRFYVGWAVNGKVTCANNSPADHPKLTVIETLDDLVKLGVTAADLASVDLGYLSETPVVGVSFQPENETLVIGPWGLVLFPVLASHLCAIMCHQQIHFLSVDVTVVEVQVL